MLTNSYVPIPHLIRANLGMEISYLMVVWDENVPFGLTCHGIFEALGVPNMHDRERDLLPVAIFIVHEVPRINIVQFFQIHVSFSYNQCKNLMRIPIWPSILARFLGCWSWWQNLYIKVN